MTRSEALISEIEGFLQRTGMTATAFGRAVAKDPALVSDIRRGRRPNFDLVASMRAFMVEHEGAHP